jgi:hypothetical protein
MGARTKCSSNRHDTQLLEFPVIFPFVQPDDQMPGPEMFIGSLTEGIILTVREEADHGIGCFRTEFPQRKMVRSFEFMDREILIGQYLHRWIGHHELYVPFLFLQLIGQCQ